MDTRGMTKQVRLSQWAGVMRERKESGMSIRSWCQEQGINEKTYYYWQRRLRKEAYEQLVVPTATNEKSIAPIQFTEVKLDEYASSLSEQETPNQLCIEIRGIRIMTSSEYPTDKLAALLRELLRPC